MAATVHPLIHVMCIPISVALTLSAPTVLLPANINALALMDLLHQLAMASDVCLIKVNDNLMW